MGGFCDLVFVPLPEEGVPSLGSIPLLSEVLKSLPKSDQKCLNTWQYSLYFWFAYFWFAKEQSASDLWSHQHPISVVTLNESV